jgi:hypothetical protein
MVRPLILGQVKSFLGLARAKDVKYLYEEYCELWSDIQAIKDYLNLETEKKLIAKKSVADTELETF